MRSLQEWPIESLEQISKAKKDEEKYKALAAMEKQKAAYEKAKYKQRSGAGGSGFAQGAAGAASGVFNFLGGGVGEQQIRPVRTRKVRTRKPKKRRTKRKTSYSEPYSYDLGGGFF